MSCTYPDCKCATDTGEYACETEAHSARTSRPRGRFSLVRLRAFWFTPRFNRVEFYSAPLVAGALSAVLHWAGWW